MSRRASSVSLLAQLYIVIVFSVVVFITQPPRRPLALNGSLRHGMYRSD